MPKWPRYAPQPRTPPRTRAHSAAGSRSGYPCRHQPPRTAWPNGASAAPHQRRSAAPHASPQNPVNRTSPSPLPTTPAPSPAPTAHPTTPTGSVTSGSSTPSQCLLPNSNSSQASLARSTPHGHPIYNWAPSCQGLAGPSTSSYGARTGTFRSARAGRERVDQQALYEQLRFVGLWATACVQEVSGDRCRRRATRNGCCGTPWPGLSSPSAHVRRYGSWSNRSQVSRRGTPARSAVSGG